ncbi:MAG: restriction endonuclease subunit S [Gammaproteobacteria bacterium]|nr:restriction endonuclease subunit S [Gammaproteobacteria bacterium]
MKDSGVEWLGKVPRHWKVRRGKWLFRHRKQINADGEEANVLSLTLRGVVNNDPENPEGLVPRDYATYQLFCKGDLVFKLIDLENLQTSRVGLVHEDGIMSPAYVRLTPKVALDIRFFYRQYFDLYLRGIYNQLGAGVRSTLGPYDLLELRVLLPPFSEQAKVVRYLDYVGRRVQQFVKAKQKLIKLLEEQKQAIIHRAVTRGLDPDVPLKDSGVKWLGKVPEHWEVKQLGRIGKFSKGSGGTKEDEVSDGIPCVRYGDLYTQHQFFIRMSRTCVTEEKAIDYVPIQFGDVLFAGSGETIEEIGKSAVNLVLGPACCGGDVIIFRPSIKINAGFLGYAADCPQSVYQKSCMGRGITVMHIYGDELKYLYVVFPPLPEQTAITEYLNSAIASIDAAIARTRREIELLQEYHTRLTADVVTGKVDVRDAAANLPDEVRDPALFREPDIPEAETDFTAEESQA